MVTDPQVYCDSMVRIRHRINVVQTIMSGGAKIGHGDQTAELIFVQFRKTLEEIAFATLPANKEKYAEVHANFSKHWRAKDMLVVMDKVNPNFYPVPLQAPIEIAPGQKHFEPLTDGFVTRDDFVLLYDCSSEALHTRNPYKEGDPTINIKYMSNVTNNGDCSWNPQPICSPPARNASSAAARHSMEQMTPAANTKPLVRTAAGCFFACSTRPKALIDRTGNTQGIKFRISPPSIADSSK